MRFQVSNVKLKVHALKTKFLFKLKHNLPGGRRTVCISRLPACSARCNIDLATRYGEAKHYRFQISAIAGEMGLAKMSVCAL